MRICTVCSDVCAQVLRIFTILCIFSIVTVCVKFLPHGCYGIELWQVYLAVMDNIICKMNNCNKKWTMLLSYII